MMLENIENYNFIDKNVLDFGCGSGILSIAAKKLNAKKIYAIDTDELAIISSKQNIELSKLLDIDLKLGSIESIQRNIKFDFIFANISSNIIIKYSDLLFSHSKKGGILLCSGILNSHRNDTLLALENSGFIFSDSFSEEDWTCLELRHE